MSAGVLADEKGLALLPAAPAPTSLRAKLRVPAILLLAILILSHGFSPLRRLYGAPAGPAFDAVSGYMRALSPSCHKISRSNLEARFLGVPQPESARNASHSFTGSTHTAGTEGDRLSALLIKNQWEALLNLPTTDDSTHIFESGTSQSRKALMGRGCKGEGRRHSTRRWIGRWGSGRWPRRQDTTSRVWIDQYFPMLNYPVSSSLTLTPAGADSPSFTAKLREDILSEDPTSSVKLPAFHGLSRNGTAKGHLVYAGRGTKQEFLDLQAQGIDFEGKIALVQYSGSFRGLKVAAAAEAGAVACLIFTDPIEDGEVTELNGHAPYPFGPARQPSSIQRGSVQFLSSYPGDPLTPYKPAYRNATRLDRNDPSINVPSIPSLPISYEDAIPLLKSLNGQGLQLAPGGMVHLGVEYWTGPGSATVELSNIMDDRVTNIWNTMAMIPGHLKDEVVVLGVHRDAWGLGAGDPVSGTASMNEIVKGLGTLLKAGYKPLRSILIASWDAEEYGLIGSTEFGEDFSAWLQQNVVAYLNVDVSVSGSAYSVSASPSLADLFKDVSRLITDPKNSSLTLLNRLVLDQATLETASQSRDLYVGPLGSGSDFTVFLQHLGIASSNLGFSRKSTDPVYHYHSVYDSAYWMDNFGDPTFERHSAISKVMGLAALRLAESPLLPINATAYAHELVYYSTKVKALGAKVDLAPLDAAIRSVVDSAAQLQVQIDKAVAELASKHKRRPSRCLVRRVRSINKRLAGLERGFIDNGGLPGREWYRNLVVAPGRYLGYGATTLPALTEAIALDHDLPQANLEVARLVQAFNGVAASLRAE